MQDLAGVAHSEVDLSIFLEPPATDETGLYIFQLQHGIIICMVHHNTCRRRVATTRYSEECSHCSLC